MRAVAPLLALIAGASATAQKPADPVAAAPTAAAWAAIARPPDLSDAWAPSISDQNAQFKINPVPWKPEV